MISNHDALKLAQGYSPRMIAAVRGVSTTSVRINRMRWEQRTGQRLPRFPPGRPHALNPHNLERVALLLKLGFSTRAIASELDVCISTIRHGRLRWERKTGERLPRRQRRQPAPGERLPTLDELKRTKRKPANFDDLLDE